jgi:hypothetical protein
MVAGQADDQAKTPLQEFGELYVGSWAADVTLIADWPGRNRTQGEKVPGYMKAKWLAGHNAILEEGAAAGSTTYAFYTWDAGARQIKWQATDSGGVTVEGTLERKGKNWAWSATGSLNDGTPLKGEGVYAFQEDGNRLVVEGEVFMGDKKLPALRDVYTRLTKCHCEGLDDH